MEPPRAVTRLCQLLQAHLGATRVTVWVLDRREAAYRPLGASHSHPLLLTPGHELLRVRRDRWPTVSGVLATGEPVRVTDPDVLATYEAHAARLLGVGSFLILALRSADVDAALFVEPATATLDDRARDLVDVLSHTVAASWQAHQARRETDRSTLLLDLLDATVDEPSIHRTLETVCRRVAQVLGADRAVVFLEGEEPALRMGAFADGRRDPGQLALLQAERPLPLAVRHPTQRGESVVLSREDGADRWWFDRSGLDVMLGVPVFRFGQPIGALVLGGVGAHPFSERDEQLASAAATLVTQVLDRARDRQQLSDDLHVRDAVVGLIEDAAFAPTVNAAMRSIADRLRHAVDVPMAAAIAVDGDRVVDIESVGLGRRAEEVHAGFRGMSLDRVPNLRAAMAAGTVVMDAVDRAHPLAHEFGIESVLATPLTAGGRTLGVVVCADTRPRRWRDRDRETAEALSRQGSLLVEAARLRELDRERIAELTELDRMKSDFLATVSHELRTPLTVVVGLAETLQGHHDALAGDQLSLLLDRLRVNGDALRTIIERLLDFSRLERGQLTVNAEDLDLAGLVARVANRVRPLLAAHPFEVHVDGALPVNADAVLLERVVENLLVNASTHTPPGTSIRVCATAADGAARVAVIDDGPGIAPRDLERITERFYRAGEHTTRETRGLGLGLAFVREILALHGAALEIASQRGHGSTFAFRLPLVGGS